MTATAAALFSKHAKIYVQVSIDLKWKKLINVYCLCGNNYESVDCHIPYVILFNFPRV